MEKNIRIVCPYLVKKLLILKQGLERLPRHPSGQVHRLTPGLACGHLHVGQDGLEVTQLDGGAGPGAPGGGGWHGHRGRGAAASLS